MTNETINETKIFGLPAEKGRWVFVLLGLIINISLGSVYAWSVFRKPLESLKTFRERFSELDFESKN